MSLFKSSLVSLFVLFCLGANAFDDNSCLMSNFETEVVHKGQPFGMTMNILRIKKNNCILEVSHEKLKFIKKKWMIDVCREPVHIKMGNGAVEVIKKTNPCSGKPKDSFCSQINDIKTVIQDDGLIFAEGEKETLSSNHGKVYCGYLLLKAYLDRDIIFSRGKAYDGVLEGGSPVKAANVPTATKSEASIPHPVMVGEESKEAVKEGEKAEEKAPEAEETPKSSGTGSF